MGEEVVGQGSQERKPKNFPSWAMTKDEKCVRHAGIGQLQVPKIILDSEAEDRAQESVRFLIIWRKARRSSYKQINKSIF